jgi:hypothetical protein
MLEEEVAGLRGEVLSTRTFSFPVCGDDVALPHGMHRDWARRSVQTETIDG